jgi:hypothetical protein
LRVEEGQAFESQLAQTFGVNFKHGADFAVPQDACGDGATFGVLRIESAFKCLKQVTIQG